MKAIFRKAFRSFSFSSHVTDLSGEDFSKIEGLNLDTRDVCRLPFEHGITVRGHRFAEDPFSIMTNELLSNAQSVTGFERAFYHRLQIEKAMTCSDFGLQESRQDYARLPGWCMTMPWERETFSRRLLQYPRRFEKNRSMHSLQFKAGFNAVDLFYSKEAALSQALQTNKLLKKIEAEGFREGKSLPLVFILLKGEAARWIMADEGNHRAHISFALGYDALLCRVKEVVRYEDLPNSLIKFNPEYDLQDARAIFNRAFYGNGPIRGFA